MISLVKTVIAIFVICTAAALPFDDGSPWKRLFDDHETEELLDFAENDPKQVQSGIDLPKIHKETLYVGSGTFANPLLQL